MVASKEMEVKNLTKSATMLQKSSQNIFPESVKQHCHIIITWI